MKLPTLLKALRSDEHKELEKFFQSPFFKASEQYLTYFRYLCKHHPGFELERPELEDAYRACFGKQSLTDSRLYNLLSGMGRQVEQFLAVKLLMPADGEPEHQLQKELLVRALGQRNMGAYFRAEAERLISELEAKPVKNMEDYHSLGGLHHQVYFNPDTPKHSAYPPNLPLAVDNLELYHGIALLRYAAEMMLREQIFQAKYEMPMLDTVLAKTGTPELVEAHPLAAVYNQLVRLYVNGVTEQGFKELKQRYAEKFHVLPREDQQILLQHLINNGISLISKDCEVQAEMLALYKIAIASDMLLDGNRITHIAFVNIVTLAANCGEHDWAWGFMEKFSTCIAQDKRQATLSIASASIYHSQGLLDEAQNSLVTEAFMLPAFDLMARWLLLKIAFDRYIREGKDYEFLVAHLSALEKFVKAKLLTKEKKNPQLNCIKLIRKILAVKFELVTVPAERKVNLQEKLKKQHPIVLRDWLQKSIESL